MSILGAMIEQMFQDLPKHMKRFSERVTVLGKDLIDRVFDFKAEVERRIANMNNKKESTMKSK